MRTHLFIFLVLLISQGNAQNTDSVLYMCKYRYSSQKDSTNKNSVFNDIMCLQINKLNSKYYSYLKQLGMRNSEEDNGKPLQYLLQMQQQGRYNADSESEIMINEFAQKRRKVLIKFKHVYCYTEDIEAQKWKIYPETKIILKQTCQKATTFYKGRSYVAWFATSIPYRIGPWEFSGLPGLILRISDTNEQFVFECTEIGPGRDKIYKEYDGCTEAPKKKVEQLRKLFATDMQTFDQIEWGASWSRPNADGTSSPVPRKIKPYNPIDLSYKLE